MDLIECYLSTSRVALQADCADSSTWREMHTLLPDLHERLTCRVCRRLPTDRPRVSFDGSAERCSVCSNHQQPTVSVGMLSKCSIAWCYKKLCAYVQQSPLYDAMCARHEDRVLVELLIEVNAPSGPVNRQNGSALNDGLHPVREPHGQADDTIKTEYGCDVDDAIKTEYGCDGDDAIKTEYGRNDDAVRSIELPSSSSAADIVLQSPAVHSESNERNGLQIFNVRSPHNNGVLSRPETPHGALPRKKKNERGCRCGNATSTPGKLTCFGQRCPCYTEQKSCDRCKCRGCRNPRLKRSNNDDLEIDQIRRKPVTLELVSSLKPSKFQKVFSPYTMHDMFQFPSHSQNYNQGGAEVTLGHVNSIFHSP